MPQGRQVIFDHSLRRNQLNRHYTLKYDTSSERVTHGNFGGKSYLEVVSAKKNYILFAINFQTWQKIRNRLPNEWINFNCLKTSIISHYIAIR